MNAADFLANVTVQTLVTFREGFEISLIIVMLLGFLTRSGRREQHRAVWTGVGVSGALCVAAAAVCFSLFGALTGRREMLAEGTVMVAATVVMTWMIVWMRTHARNIKGELHGGLTLATTNTAVLAFAAMAVAREGFETVMILLSANAQSSSPLAVVVSATLGFGAAAGLCTLIYRHGRRMDLQRFFRYTGLALIAFAVYSLGKGTHGFIELAAPGTFVALSVGIGVPAVYAIAMLRWFLLGERRPARPTPAQQAPAPRTADATSPLVRPATVPAAKQPEPVG